METFFFFHSESYANYIWFSYEFVTLHLSPLGGKRRWYFRSWLPCNGATSASHTQESFNNLMNLSWLLRTWLCNSIVSRPSYVIGTCQHHPSHLSFPSPTFSQLHGCTICALLSVPIELHFITMWNKWNMKYACAWKVSWFSHLDSQVG